MDYKTIGDMKGGVLEEVYQTYPGIRRSDLWYMSRSPKHFKHHMDNPPEPTPALTFGIAAHMAVLEPERFAEKYVPLPDGVDRRTKVGREQYAALLDAAAKSGKTIISAADYDKAKCMAEALRGTYLGEKYLGGVKEVPILWLDTATGIYLKCRCDILSIDEETGKIVVVDYKTTTDASTHAFNSQIFRNGYHFQAAFYTEGVKNAFGLDYTPEFVLLAQEKAAPYVSNAIVLPEDVVGVGYNRFREYLGTYAECVATGYWPGYNGALDTLNEAYLPGYLSANEEEGGEEE